MDKSQLIIWLEITGVVTLMIVAVTLALYIIIESQRKKLPKRLVIVRMPFSDPQEDYSPGPFKETENALSRFKSQYNFVLIECDVDRIEFEMVSEGTIRDDITLFKLREQLEKNDQQDS